MLQKPRSHIFQIYCVKIKKLDLIWCESLPSLPPKMESKSWSNAARPEDVNIKCRGYDTMPTTYSVDITNLTAA